MNGKQSQNTESILDMLEEKKKHINYTTCNQYEQFIYSVYLIHVCVKYLSIGIVFYCNVVILLSIWGITASMKW